MRTAGERALEPKDLTLLLDTASRYHVTVKDDVELAIRFDSVTSPLGYTVIVRSDGEGGLEYALQPTGQF